MSSSGREGFPGGEDLPRVGTPRFLVDPGSIREGEAVLRGPEWRHAVQVLRLGPGDPVTLLDGRGHRHRGRLVEVKPREARVRIEGTETPLTEAPVPVTLFLSLLKADRFEWALQKAVELGAAAVHAFVSRRSVVRPLGEGAAEAARRLARWRRIAESAACQSGRSRVPEVAGPDLLEEVLGRLDRYALAILPWEEGGEPLGRVLEEARGASPVAVLVGPEGGFQEEEVARARQSGARVVSLGPRILRSETAAVTAVALVIHRLGDLG